MSAPARGDEVVGSNARRRGSVAAGRAHHVRSPRCREWPPRPPVVGASAASVRLPLHDHGDHAVRNRAVQIAGDAGAFRRDRERGALIPFGCEPCRRLGEVGCEEHLDPPDAPCGPHDDGPPARPRLRRPAPVPSARRSLRPAIAPSRTSLGARSPNRDSEKRDSEAESPVTLERSSESGHRSTRRRAHHDGEKQQRVTPTPTGGQRHRCHCRALRSQGRVGRSWWPPRSQVRPASRSRSPRRRRGTARPPQPSDPAIAEDRGGAAVTGGAEGDPRADAVAARSRGPNSRSPPYAPTRSSFPAGPGRSG